MAIHVGLALLLSGAFVATRDALKKPEAETPAVETNVAARVEAEPEPVPAVAQRPSEPAVVPKPVAATVPKVEKREEPRKPAPAEKAEREWIVYMVKPGDTLTALATRAGCSLSELARHNKKTVAVLSRLKVGQRIRLPKVEE